MLALIQACRFVGSGVGEVHAEATHPKVREYVNRATAVMLVVKTGVESYK